MQMHVFHRLVKIPTLHIAGLSAFHECSVLVLNFIHNIHVFIIRDMKDVECIILILYGLAYLLENIPMPCLLGSFSVRNIKEMS